MSTRHPAVAGMFYPLESNELLEFVKNSLDRAKDFGHAPKILVSPHAGYIYSGATAGYCYKQLGHIRSPDNTCVVLIGPSHRVGFSGMAFTPDDYFSTPLGSVEVARERIESFLATEGEKNSAFIHEAPHRMEHSLEVQIPFLQVALPGCRIIPIVYGQIDYKKVLCAIEFFMQDKDTVVIISSDLSHYHPYDVARHIDSQCTQAVERLDLVRMQKCEACGEIGIKSAIEYALSHGLRSVTLDYKTSGDTAGDKQSVVGYGSYMFFEE